MTPSLLNITPELTASVAAKTAAAQALLADIAGNWSPATFANSLGAEDMVLTDLIAKSGLPIEIFSLDTGRLPLETYDLDGCGRPALRPEIESLFPAKRCG